MRIEEKEGKLIVTDFDEFDAFRIAGKIEKDGIEFYGQLASSVKGAEVKEALEFLLGEEKKHLRFFEDEIQRLRNEKEDADEEDDLLTTMDYGTFSAYPNATELDAVLDDMIFRCRELDLRAVGSDRKLVADFTVLLTAKTMHALFGPSRRKWIAL